jgi:hypothetical protein
MADRLGIFLRTVGRTPSGPVRLGGGTGALVSTDHRILTCRSIKVCFAFRVPCKLFDTLLAKPSIQFECVEQANGPLPPIEAPAPLKIVRRALGMIFCATAGPRCHGTLCEHSGQRKRPSRTPSDDQGAKRQPSRRARLAAEMIQRSPG